jgi:hypothetical protein
MFKGLFTSKSQEQRNKSEIKGTKFKDKELADKWQDPLNKYHQEGGMKSNSFDVDGDGQILSEDEMLILERDPENSQNKWVEAENIADPSYQEPYAETDFQEDIDNIFLEKRENMFKELGINPPKKVVPFEERDLMAESFKKIRDEREKDAREKIQREISNNIESNVTRKKIDQLESYLPHEFDLMQNCFRYKVLLDRNPDQIRKRPVDDHGQALSDADIKKWTDQYEDCKTNNKWKQYAEDDKAMMRACGFYNDFYKEISKARKNPTFADGSPLSHDQIDEQAAEYIEFKNSNPDEVVRLQAELNVEKGKWKKSSFDWKKADNHWYCYKSKEVNGKKIVKRYATQTEPSMANTLIKGNDHINYFTVVTEKHEDKGNEDYTSITVRLQPIVEQKQNEKQQQRSR